MTSGAASSLHELENQGVISGARRQRLADIHRIRNDAQHDYPDVRARLVYEAAQQLVSEALGFLQDYFRWLQREGYRRPS